ncbi:MAG: TonB-dependent receptor [Gammaproteobacteria bacterium]|nr:TonB-dependent receptor [Gammaproteobacteria bacterium]MYF00424.1 TonB-dependent receptor [Gammaproteobacteria bacterium]MYG96126.1 TonB-dependent receptor [Gammaproteobacteria bacterium]
MSFKRTIVATAVGAAVQALAPQAFAQDIEEIVTVGIRGSLQAAADLKRNDARIIDAIAAEDIGKLPDNNIAEALQRVTGVSINREYGVGNEVSIRGLNNNRVEINGRSTLGDSRNGISLDDMPSAFLSAVEVVKSPTPEMIEGALGGTVNMKTLRPIDLGEQIVSVSLDMEYADKTENSAPIFNATYGNNWELDNGGTFGVVASLSYQDRSLRQDTFQQDLRVQDGFDINNDGVINLADEAQNTPSGNYVISREHKYEPWVEHRERTAANLSFQWAPNERGNLYTDLNFTDRSGGEEAYSVLMAGGSATNALGTAYEDANGQLSGYVLEGAFILPKTWSEFRETKSFSHAFGGEFDLTEKMQVSFEFATAESDQVEPKSEFNWRAHDQAAEALDPAGQNRHFVDAVIDVSNHNAVPGVDYLSDANPFLEMDRLALREFRHLTDDIFNAEDAFRVDFEYSNPVDLEWFTAFKAGLRTTDRDYERSSKEFRSPNLHQALTTADGSEYVVWTMTEFDALFPGTLVNPFQPGDLFDQAGYASANQTAPFVLYDAARLSGDLEGTFDIIKQLLAGTNREVTGSLASNLSARDSAYTKIGEETAAAYLQADLDFDRVRIVFGGRYVETDVTSSAFQDGVLVSDTETYADFLPSINASVDLTDNTILRASGAKVMRRANFGDLSPAYNFNSDVILASRGNPGLEPFRAAQFDFGVEHYWDGNMVSATVFYKDVASFLKESIYCAYFPGGVSGQNHNAGAFDQICILPAGVRANSDIYTDTEDEAEFLAFVADGRNGVKTTTVTNGSNGTIQGFELGTVYNFDFLPGAWSGLGINANFTLSQSEDPNGVALEDISETSYNLQLFWEYESLSARLAWTSRERFLDDTAQKRTEHIGALVASNTIDLENDPTQGNSFRDGIDQLDISGSWQVNDSLTIVGSITNLTGEHLVNSTINGIAWQIRESDRRFSLGARYTF